MSAYPEHDKLVASGDRHMAIVEFLEFIEFSGYSVMRLSDYQPYERIPSYDVANPADLVATYFEIDTAAFEREKRAMLAQLRGEAA